MHALIQSVIEIAARGEGSSRNVRVFVQRRFAYLTIILRYSLRIQSVLLKAAFIYYRLTSDIEVMARGPVCAEEKKRVSSGNHLGHLLGCGAVYNDPRPASSS